jgi:heme exporter protein D
LLATKPHENNEKTTPLQMQWNLTANPLSRFTLVRYFIPPRTCIMDPLPQPTLPDTSLLELSSPTPDAASSLLSMGGYGAYVWPAYAVALLVLAVLFISSYRAYFKAKRRLSSLQSSTDSENAA